MAACNHPGTQSGPSGVSFLSIMARCKQDDRNTGCIHTYYFIRHLHSASQEAEQHQSEKETPTSHTNEPQREERNRNNDRKSKNRKVWEDKIKRKHGKHDGGKRNNEKPKKAVSGEKCEEIRGRMETTEENTGNAKRIGEISGQRGFCTGMQAQLHSPVMQQVLLFTHAAFPWQHMQESI